MYNTGKMPANDANQEFPSESAATFEESKKAVEAKDAEKQKTEGSTTETDKSDDNIDEAVYPSEKDETKSDDTNNSTGTTPSSTETKSDNDNDSTDSTANSDKDNNNNDNQ